MINLNVDFKDIDLAQEIADQYDEDGDRIGGTTLAAAIVGKIAREAIKGGCNDGLHEAVRAIRIEEIRAAVRPAVEEAMTAPFQPTNGYGEPRGNPVTMREYIVQVAQAWMKESANDRHGSDRKSNIEALVRQHVESAMKAEIAEAVKAARESVVANIGKSISEVVTQAVREGIRSRA